MYHETASDKSNGCTKSLTEAFERKPKWAVKATVFGRCILVWWNIRRVINTHHCEQCVIYGLLRNKS